MKKINSIPRTIEERLDCALTSADNLKAMEDLAGMEAWQFFQQNAEDTIIREIDNVLQLCDDPVKNLIPIVVSKTIIATLSKILHTKNATINRKPHLQDEIIRLMNARTQNKRESA